MITVHHLNNSRSQRVLWLLEELNLPYEVIRYERDPATLLAPASLKAVHPLGKSPVVTDGEVTIAETGAIVEYLLDAHGAGRLRPGHGTEARRRFTYWLHYAEGSAMPPLLLKLAFRRMEAAPAPFFARPILKKAARTAQDGFIDPQIAMHMDYWDAELGKAPWLAGPEFTAADIMMSFPIEAACARIGGGGRPNLKIFLNRIHSRPAYMRALERGGPFAIAG